MAQARHEVGSMKAWIVCLSVGLFFFYEFIQLNVFDVLNPVLRQDFSLNASQLSLLSSAFLWANLLFLLPAGILLDYISVRRVVCLTLLLCILGVFGLAFSHHFIAAFASRFLMGIGNAFCFLSCVILVSRWFPHTRQGLVMGLLVTLAFVGGMVAHTPFALLMQSMGWRTALGVDVILGVLILGVIYMNVLDAPYERSIAHQANQKLSQAFLSVLRNRQTYCAGLYTALLNLPVMVLCALWGGSYLAVVYNMSAMEASRIVSALFLGSMIGCPALGWLSDMQGQRKPVMWFGVVGTLLSLLPLFISSELSFWTLSSIFFALGFFTSSQVMSYPLIAESEKPQLVGEATGVASMIIMGSAAFGQILFGFLMQHRAGSVVLEYAPIHFQYAMKMFPIAVILAGVVLMWIRETHCKPLFVQGVGDVV